MLCSFPFVASVAQLFPVPYPICTGFSVPLSDACFLRGVNIWPQLRAIFSSQPCSAAMHATSSLENRKSGVWGSALRHAQTLNPFPRI